MKDNLFYRLFTKADLTDTVEPDFKLSARRRRKITRDAMRKIKAEEGIEKAPARISRRTLIAAVALAVASVMLVSAVGITHILWRPDVGLTDLEGNPVEADASVYTSTTAADFGGLRLTYVISTGYNGGSALSVWLIGEGGDAVTDLVAEREGKSYPLTYNGCDGEEGHNYISTDCPLTEAVTIRSAALGAEAAFTLVERENASIFVPEHFGISFELIPMGEEMHVIIIDRGILGTEMSQYARMRLIQGTNWRFYDAEGNLYVSHGGGAGSDDYGRSFMAYDLTHDGEQNYSVVSDDGNLVVADDGSIISGGEEIVYEAQPVNAADIVRVELDSMTFRYKFTDEVPGGELPIPADGETITGDFVTFSLDGFTDRIDSIKREGNTLILHQPKVALDYTGTIPVSDTEGNQEVYLYDADGKQLGSSSGWGADYAGDDSSGATLSRTITMEFADGLLDKAATAKIVLADLWIYLDQAWSVDLG